jgi:toxin ParE1/3/4
VKLEWSQLAIADREQIFDYIEADNPHAAIVVDRRIKKQIEDLRDFPLSGRPGRIENTRELVIIDTPFIVAYRVDAESIRILRVLHGAQRWPRDLTNA